MDNKKMVMKIFYLPLEPIEKRYTKQWYYWFKEVFDSENINFEYIDGDKNIRNEISSSSFLDIRNTFIWKFKQLHELFKKEISDDDIIFIPDGEFPGLESLEYYRKFYNKKFKIIQIWHAGTYDSYDLTSQKGLGRIGNKIEEVIFDIADLIFVGSKFHKNLILNNRMVDRKKIVVTGLPTDVININKKYYRPWKEKNNTIVFGGRTSIEKGIDIIEKLKKNGYNIVTTISNTSTKNEYYNYLSNSKILLSPARQETFGYCSIEAMACGTIPIVPDKLSYREYVPKKYRYKTELDIEDLICKYLDTNITNKEQKKLFKIVSKFDYKKVIKNMIKWIEKLF